MAQTFHHYIHGEWTAAADGRTFEQRNPAHLDEVTGIWPSGSREDAGRAIAAAAEAYPGWRALSPYQRAAYLKRAYEGMVARRDEFAEVLTSENGKTLNESKAEIDAAIREMEFQIHEGVRMGGETLPTAMDGVLAYSVRRPLGAVSIISPWNFPFNVPGRKVTPALMAGNTCVFKPASLTPQTGLRFVELFVEARLPAGVLNFVTGSGSTVGEEMITHPAIQAVSFTGSTAVGEAIHRKAAEHMARTQLEMGGKNPIVVLEDADLEAAAQSATTAAYACAGQWCTSTSRAIVVRDIADRFVQRVLELASALVVGDGREPRTTMGPVCGEAQLAAVLKYIELGREEGASVRLGGNRLTGETYDNGCYIEPTVFTGVTPDMTIARDEIFGPVLSVMEVADFEQAVEIANQVDFGLASSIYTADVSRAFTFLERTEVGLTHVNLMTSLKEPQLSFGGIRASGHGVPEAGRTGIEFFSEHKVVYVKYR
jgi:aldehyde dehydrogenase (NAD+)